MAEMPETAPQHRAPPTESEELPELIGGGPPPLQGRLLSDAEIMAQDDHAAYSPPPRRVAGTLLSDAEIMALGDDEAVDLEDHVGASIEHARALTYAGSVLETRYAERDDVMVCTDHGLQYRREEPSGTMPIPSAAQASKTSYVPTVVPDVMVLFGVPRWRSGGAYRTWKNGGKSGGKVPDFVLEVVSHNNWQNDYERKHDLYERLGVHEYFIFEPRETRGRVRLTAYRLNTAERYEEVLPAMHDGLGTGILSESLGLVAFVDAAQEFGLWDPASKERLRDHNEEHIGRLREREARETAERALAKSEAARAESEAALAESEAARAKSEAARAESEAALAALQARLAALQDGPDAGDGGASP